MDAGEADKPKEEKCKTISEKKKNTDQKSDECLELKDSKKDQVLNSACLEDNLDHGGPNRGPLNNLTQFKSCRSRAAAAFYNKEWRAYGTESRVAIPSGILENTLIFGQK